MYFKDHNFTLSINSKILIHFVKKEISILNLKRYCKNMCLTSYKTFGIFKSGSSKFKQFIVLKKTQFLEAQKFNLYVNKSLR